MVWQCRFDTSCKDNLGCGNSSSSPPQSGNSPLSQARSEDLVANVENHESNMNKPEGTSMLGSDMKNGKTVGPVAGKRPKVALQPGRSLMDWVRLGLSGKDLQGRGGQIRKVTMEELSEHSQEDDCWMLIRGRVYNITPYLEYHPGGIPELMQAAGKDGTHLFDEVHKWVNVESMLAKCFVGPIEEKSIKPTILEKPSLKKLLIKPSPDLLLDGGQADSKTKIPRYDWYQNEDSVILTIYTKDKDVTEDNLIADCSDGKLLDCKVLFQQSFYRIHLQLDHEISNLIVKPSCKSSGKIELVLEKCEAGTKWSSLGKKLEGNGELCDEKDRDLVRRKCRLSAISQVTSNTKLFSIELPKMVYYNCPVGYHVLIEEKVQGFLIGKNYTVVLDKLDYEDRIKTGDDCHHLHLMIKIYTDGALTPVLNQLHVGDFVTVSECIGNFKLSRLTAAKSIYMIAAGTGLTPMIRIMDYIARDEDAQRDAHLLFSNRNESDILWHEEIDRFTAKHQNLFEVKYILSKPPDGWAGLRGRINKDILLEFFGDINKPSKEDELLICICGSDEFTEMINECLLSMNFTENMIHCFLG